MCVFECVGCGVRVFLCALCMDRSHILKLHLFHRMMWRTKMCVFVCESVCVCVLCGQSFDTAV